ncbi:MAG: MMPL family transporter, partial [Gemmatimonadales bacterium]
MIALPARSLIHRRGWVIAAWAALALLFAPKATHVQSVLSVRGTAVDDTESARASQLIKNAFPNPIAEYVAIVVRGPVRWTHPRFHAVLDSITATLARQSYVTQVVSVRTLGESTFVSRDRRTTFVIAALTPSSSNDDLSRTVVPALRSSVQATLARLPRSADFDVMVTGNPALDHDVRTISTEDTRRSE